MTGKMSGMTGDLVYLQDMDLVNLGLFGLFLGTFLAGTVVPFSSDVLYVAIMAVMPEKWLACLIVAVVGNTLGTISTYFVGRAGKTEWIEKIFRVKKEKVEAQQSTVQKYGPFAGLIGWVPFVGKPLLIALGFYKAPKFLTNLMIFIGIAIRFSVWTLILGGCGANNNAFSHEERIIIEQSDSVMYVCELGKDDQALRTVSVDLSNRELKSEELETLISKMMFTVQDPSQGGVGIAAPQVGVNKRVICVQRLDKEEEPFECYLNIHIDKLYGDLISGYEGCLSVPPYRGLVSRYDSVAVSYLRPGMKKVMHEKIGGYTARIFQHEIDHLDAVLYIDRADTVFVSEAWAKEREEFTYSRPEWWPR